MTKSKSISGKTLNKDVDRLVDTLSWAFVGMLQISVDENYPGNPLKKTERGEIHLEIYDGVKEFLYEYMLNKYNIDMEE
jgi:hypothetical protein